MCLGIPGQVVAIADPNTQLGVVDVGGVRRQTSLVMVRREGEPIDALVGSWVLIHVGFAMSRIDEVEARRTLALLQEMGEAMALEGGGPS